MKARLRSPGQASDSSNGNMAGSINPLFIPVIKHFFISMLLAGVASTFLTAAEPSRFAPSPADPNLRFPPPTDAQLDAIAAMLPAKPQGVGRPITDRAAWAEAAKQPFFQKQITDAATYAKQPIPEITEKMLTDVATNGRRDTYEVPFVLRTKRLDAFVIAECIQDQGTYLPNIEAELNAILHETTWADSVSIAWNQLDGGRDYAVDLGVAARAWTLATCDYFLGDKLKPETRQAIRDQERHRVFDHYEASVRSGVPLWWWMAVKANWNAVCNTGELGAALTLIDSPRERALYVYSIQNELRYYMQGFSNDGYCFEGFSYWGYGYGNYLRSAELLYEQTHGQINLFAGDLQRQVALFPVHLQVIPQIWPAYGDCWAKYGPIKPGVKLTDVSGAFMDLINQRWNLGLNVDLSTSDMTVTGALGENLSGFGMFGFPRPSFGPPPGSPPVDATADEDKRFFFKDASVLVCRSIQPDKPPFGLSIKGLHNGLPHGHEDNGSYVIAYGDFPLLLDPGMENYVANSMNSHRYESMMMNSYGHDVPWVGKTLQKPGADAMGKVVSTTFTDDKDTLVMDLTTSYPVPSLVHLWRTYIFDRKATSIEIDDDVQFSKPTDYGAALITISQEKEEGAGAFLVYDKSYALAATVTAEETEPAAQVVNKVEPVTGFRLYASIHPIRMGVNLSQPVTHVRLKTVIAPAALPPEVSKASASL